MSIQVIFLVLAGSCNLHQTNMFNVQNPKVRVFLSFQDIFWDLGTIAFKKRYIYCVGQDLRLPQGLHFFFIMCQLYDCIVNSLSDCIWQQLYDCLVHQLYAGLEHKLYDCVSFQLYDCMSCQLYKCTMYQVYEYSELKIKMTVHCVLCKKVKC